MWFEFSVRPNSIQTTKSGRVSLNAELGEGRQNVLSISANGKYAVAATSAHAGTTPANSATAIPSGLHSLATLTPATFASNHLRCIRHDRFRARLDAFEEHRAFGDHAFHPVARADELVFVELRVRPRRPRASPARASPCAPTSSPSRRCPSCADNRRRRRPHRWDWRCRAAPATASPAAAYRGRASRAW